MDNERIIGEVAAYKTDSRRLFENAVEALIALAFRYHHLGVNFLWDSDPVLERECNRILRDLSEGEREAAKKRASALIEEEGWDEDAFEMSDKEGEDSLLWRFDMAGSHLRELLEIWLAIAFVEGMTQAYLKICVLRYLGNPFAAPMWSRLPRSLIRWGAGYQKDIAAQFALIGQDAIVNAVRLAEWLDAAEKGATYYIRRRGSNYDCPECDAACGVPIPMDVPFEESHARCMCWPEYHFDNEGV